MDPRLERSELDLSTQNRASSTIRNGLPALGEALAAARRLADARAPGGTERPRGGLPTRALPEALSGPFPVAAGPACEPRGGSDRLET
jgi:hypothetical protein